MEGAAGVLPRLRSSCSAVPSVGHSLRTFSFAPGLPPRVTGGLGGLAPT